MGEKRMDMLMPLPAHTCLRTWPFPSTGLSPSLLSCGGHAGIVSLQCSDKRLSAPWKPHISRFLSTPAPPHPNPGASWMKTSAPSPGWPGFIEAGKREWGRDH